nr:MAG TPA: hypothetical protein [Caudoviricetes sp.]
MGYRLISILPLGNSLCNLLIFYQVVLQPQGAFRNPHPVSK